MQTLVTRARTITSTAFAVSLEMLVATALSIRCAILRDVYSTKLHAKKQNKANKVQQKN
jgi:heme exporter protein D